MAMLMKTKARVLVVAVSLLLFCMPAFSQVNLGRISGNVTDQTGGVVAGATVTITDQDRGTVRSVVTDAAGSYAAPSLIPGQYTVKVEATGFNASELKDVEAQIKAATLQKDDAEKARLKGLVTMYENMKPRDAAKIFDGLDPNVLLEVAAEINPRTMADIAAQMSPDVAQRLTVELADKAQNQVKAGDASVADLPKIQGQSTTQ